MRVKDHPNAWKQLLELTEPTYPDTERAVIHPLDDELIELIYPDDSRQVVQWNGQQWESV